MYSDVDGRSPTPWWQWVISGLQIAVGAVLVATGLGAGFGAMLLAGGVMGMISNVLGSTIGGGIGSMMNGWGAISTGISLFSFGPIGWILGGVSILIGGATMIMGANEVVSGITGTNYLSSRMGSDLYGGLYLGLNIASSIATIAGRLGMRIAGTKTIGANDPLRDSGQKPYARITRGNNTYYFDGKGNAYWSNHHTNLPIDGTPKGMHWHAGFGRDGNHIYSYLKLLLTLILGG